MTPKKAIIILLILFLAVAIVFVVLYINNQPAANRLIRQPTGNGYNLSASSTNQEKLSPAQQQIKAIEAKTQERVEQIVEQGKTATGGITKEAATKLEETINQAIMEEAKLKTPEQIEADKQKQAEREKMEQEINQRIKSQLK